MCNKNSFRELAKDDSYIVICCEDEQEGLKLFKLLFNMNPLLLSNDLRRLSYQERVEEMKSCVYNLENYVSVYIQDGLPESISYFGKEDIDEETFSPVPFKVVKFKEVEWE